MTTTMKLSAINPEYLLARVEVDEARRNLQRAEREPEILERRNADHAAEVAAAERTGGTLLTNGVALERGSGAGFEVIYQACDCDGTGACLHDPRVPPYSDQDIADAHQRVTKAKRALASAQKKLVATKPEWDAFAAARDSGAGFVWWPMAKYTDPRLKRYRGKPVTADELEALGVHELNRAIRNGSVIEVPR